MGCGGSKVDDLPLVILCRERKQLIKAASDHRLALAAAHLSYFHSLHDVGDAIRKFVDEELVLAAASSSSPGSPVLTLPPHANGKPKPKSKSKSKSSSSSTSISHSLDGDSYHDNHNNRSPKVKNTNNNKNHHHHDDDDGDSHLHLSSSDSDLNSDSGHGDFHHHHRHHHENPEREEEFRGPVGGMEMPSTSYGDFNNYPAQGNWGYGYPGEPIPPANPYPYPDPYANPYPAPYSNPYPDANPYPSINPYPNQNMYYMKRSTTPAKTVVVEDPSAPNGYWGSGSYYGNGAGYFGGYPPPTMREPSPPKPPPAPPSPPRASTWDFLNVFESVDNGGTGGGGGGFHGYHTSDRYVYGSITSSPDSREVREREGIPDLEDETEHEVIKEVPREKKRINEERGVNNNGKSRFNEEFLHNYGEGTSKAVPVDTSSSSIESVESSSMRGRGNVNGMRSSKGKGIKTSMSPDTIPSPDSIVSMRSPQEEEPVKRKGVSFEVVEETSSVTMDAESEKPNISMMNTLSAHGTRDIQEVVKEIRDEFETATNYGKEIGFMLEVNKLPYQRQTTPLKVLLLRILSMKAQAKSSVQITSKVMKIAKMYSEQTVNEFDIHPINLSSTLAKLYAWEKKLYKEVKEEERLRVIYEKECKRLKQLDDRGEESSKIEATQDSIRKLMTKLNVCVRAVDSISCKIHKLRDEELQPQITALIHGLIRMWRSMLRCHQKQFQAIMESKVRSLKANTLQRDSGLKATLELEMELVEWCSRFNNWIKTQKSYVESLNGWLLRCIVQEPEETADGVAPFSPSRMGAPPIFVICNDWYEGMLRVSEKGVENAMLDFASNLQQLWERQDQEQRQRIKTEYLKKDLEKQIKTLRMERGKRSEQDAASSDKAVSKVPSESGVSPLDDLKVDLDSMRKKLDEERARHKETAKLVHDAASSSLQAGLLPIFEALGSFTSEILKVHEDVRLVEGGTA
ncbi:Protein ALTERED PHOSPHATE STARVATION RESPONSE 1 [Linum grandiflorum]